MKSTVLKATTLSAAIEDKQKHSEMRRFDQSAVNESLRWDAGFLEADLNAVF